MPFNSLICSFPPMIQAKYGRSGKWDRSNSFFSSNGGSSNGNKRPPSSKGGFGGFDSGFDGSKPRESSSELVFFSTGKSFASYPLDYPIMPQKNSTAEALKNTMIPSEVKCDTIIIH